MNRQERHAGSRVRPSPLQAQRGVALAISLVLMVAMTILGVATLSGTRLNEKITSNAQLKAVAFEVAESAIRSTWDAETLKLTVSQAGLETNDPEAIRSETISTELGSAYDQVTDSRGTNIEGSLTVQYCGETLPQGTSLNADESDSQQKVAILVDVNGVSEVENTMTRADHVQRGALVVPRTGRSGSCLTR